MSLYELMETTTNGTVVRVTNLDGIGGGRMVARESDCWTPPDVMDELGAEQFHVVKIGTTDKGNLAVWVREYDLECE